MSGPSVGESQPRPSSGRKTLRRCRNNGATDNVVLIDVESDNFDNIIIIDVPESLSKKLRGSSSRKDKRYPRKTVIYIDDDESPDSNHSDVEVNENGDFSNGTSSSPAANDDGNSSDAVGDECQFVQENISPVKISKCKRTYSGKASASNRYGLGSDSEIDSSDDDFPDCELVEDSFGRFREQWEKASLKRKCDNRYGQSGIGVCNNSSRVSPNIQQNIGAENMPEQHKEGPDCSSSGKTSCERDESFPSNVTRNSTQRSSACNSKKGRFGDYLPKTRLKTRFPYAKADIDHKSDPSSEDSASNSGEKQDHQKFEHGGPSSQDTGQGTQGSPFKPQHEEGSEPVNHVRKASEGNERAASTEPCTSKNESGEEVFCNGKAGLVEEPRPQSNEFMEEEELVHAESSFMKTKISDEQLNHDFAHCSDSDQVGPVQGENIFCSSSLFNSGINMDKGHQQENGELFKEKLTSCDYGCNNEDDVVPANDGENMHVTESCIISDREKLKETDEYKRAIEEEWAARQRALQIQAEEAQQLRRLQKRIKAERIRLLDMERRQKERLEEMRETQKKDEEHMNLKELMRAEIRRELSKLELECHDMASLLRCLGITVGSELKPLPHEVRAACKRALFTFHPDRASKFDTRQQVESEEKFKLISRMKEKFLLT